MLKSFLVALVTLVALALPASAAEVIRSFASAVTVNVDGSVDVTETITVMAEGNEIRRGIYRDIPTELVAEDGTRLRSNLKVREVLRAGRAEPYSVESIGSGFRRIRIGDADVFLPRGEHTYTISYSMDRMARRFADHDEIYWNATGNYWNFPIERAVASVTLPDGAVISDLSGYTGATGSDEQAVTITREADNRALFRATRVLAPGEGMTVAASFQKGVLTTPNQTDRALYWLSDNRDALMPGVAALLVLLYYLFAWNAVGRDPKKGTIVPLFHAPKGYSPALVHYIHNMGWKKSGWTAFTAAIFNLGAKGLIRVANRSKVLTVSYEGDPEDTLPPGEQVLFNYFKGQRQVTVNTKNGPTLHKKRSEFTNVLESENRQAYFKNNTGYVVMGFVLSAAALISLVVADVLDPVFLVLSLVGGVAIGLFSSLLGRFWTTSIFGKVILLIWIALAGGNLFAGASGFLDGLDINAALIGALTIVVINVVFAILMRAPTVQGRQLMDQIEGFRMYLETAEKNRLNMTNEPPMTVERFERILPYAIALGVEKPWSEHFEGELSRNAVEGVSAGSYHPAFYTGQNWSNGGFSNSVAAVATGMSAAMIASQPASSSSSGSSGGGFSGGGGGGGGGGGW
ncbi:DUF2207 domain-containing protein [Devosia sp.]|uniref:DUF2207 domain-containing protein n=1 Tax=Devosia sp. TaxID=1871048 RepID=UPI003A949EEC